MSDSILMRPEIPGEDAPVVVDVKDVSMVFNMASEQLNSLKEYFIKLARRELLFEEFHALDHVSFQVRRGEAFGLVGTNGSGKSTMLKIIAGVLEATSGTCEVHGVIAPLIFIFILIPGAVKRFFINFLRMSRQNMLNAVGEFLFIAIGHTDLLFEH